MKPSFSDQTKLFVYLKRLEELRNPISHSRGLSPFEADLVSGISGEIRQQVTLYLSAMEGEKQHFPRIERVEDSFGNVAMGLQSGASSSVKTDLVLHPGQVLTFKLDAWDPDDMPPTWNLMAAGTVEKAIATGNHVIFEWTVTDSVIGDPSRLIFQIVSPRDYHRSPNLPKDDDRCSISYRILPES